MPRAVFRQRYRLQTPAQYRDLYRSGARGRTRYFAWRTHANDLPHARLGLAVPKKHLRRAVDRNLVRRIIRESFRHRSGSLPCVDILVILIAIPDLDDRQALSSDLKQLWCQAAQSASSNANNKPTPAALDAATT